ncbi:hypothetical protein BCR34DRAFT_624922 [Clohesyomyces aquaticus]|uniref:Fumarylacetoacetase-like C-terminal domain-containing protein n=1 Tax=Clohesyomyces aquaticus TaxID=1231657 RepID=A0A1Y1ZM45_9PLEO|nr:hypothetical protein BCR34DRAFT_624922 [Clohesyomyces aquaticus]
MWASKRPYKRLIRFLAPGRDKVFGGEPILPEGSTSINDAKIARFIRGDPLRSTYEVTDQIFEIKSLQSILPRVNSHNIIRCLGVNYRSHALEAKLPIPEHPVLFYKPTTAVCDPPHIDYECELVVVIGDHCRDVSPEEALDHVAGYTVGNDVSHREWQLHRGGGQWGFGKGFDTWAPIGPGIVTPEEFGENDPGRALGPGKGLRIWTKLNGETVQEGWTGDMIFGVAETISRLSQGTSLRRGNMIFMGTPSGVGMSRNPPLWMKDGDVVEVGVDGIGSCKNTGVFDNAMQKIVQPHSLY